MPREDVAITILASLIDRPAPEFELIDAGSKVFSGDETREGSVSVLILFIFWLFQTENKFFVDKKNHLVFSGPMNAPNSGPKLSPISRSLLRQPQFTAYPSRSMQRLLRRMLAISSILVLAGVQQALAAVIVSFNSDEYTTSNFAHMAGYTSGIPSVPYSESTFRNPTIANYDDSLPSAKFYGGAITDGADGLTTYRVTASGRLVVASSSDGSTVTQIVVWKQEDFLAFSSGDVGFDSSTSISFTLRAGASGRTAAFRVLIEQYGMYYLSEVITTASGTSTVNHTISDPTVLEWFNYDPLNNMTAIGSSASLGDLYGLTAVGFWAQGTSTGTASPAVTVHSLTFNAIPEPGTAALLLLVGTFVVVSQARRRWGKAGSTGALPFIVKQ